jgi:hypothetical protein
MGWRKTDSFRIDSPGRNLLQCEQGRRRIRAS